mgnify:FL=1|jgi:hypothetical protein
MPFLINITSYITSLSKNVFNTKLINQSEIANIICLNLSYLFLVYPANSKSTIMIQNNDSDNKHVVEVVFTLKRVITRQNKNIIDVSRTFEVNGERIYIDHISREVWHNTLDNPDIFRLVELFAMGDLDIRKHTTYGTKDGKHFVKLVEFIRCKLRLHKLYFYIQSFKLR